MTILRHVRYLKAVVDHGSFTRAAQALHVSQPALSQQIKELEERVGAQLLDRSGRKIRATDLGTIYLQHAGRALAELEQAIRAVRDVEDLSTGTLRLGVTPSVASYFIGPVLQRFRKHCPGVTLSVRVSSQEAIEPALRDDELDLGIGFGDLPAEDIEATPLHEERPMLIVGKKHRVAGKAAVTAKELAQMPLAILDASFSTRRLVDHYLRSKHLRASIVVEANSIEALTDIVRHTDLATILPANVIRPGLVAIKLQPAMETRRAALLRRRHAYCSAATRAFIAIAQEMAAGFQ
ncbi:transcriptional regulator CynR [Dyella japonica]|uniref:LysR family cyn operon transcriptional activator n=1 Tax=Dyella japonica TaxID=231455 RepID=A0ABV2JYQ8_9GAMM